MLRGQEDCLLLNIYIPENAMESPLPVMAWIHGGSLRAGSNRIDTQGTVCPNTLTVKWTFAGNHFHIKI